jgi:MFS family permease
MRPAKAAEIAHSPQDYRRNTTMLLISTLTIMSGATISASLPGIAARFADVDNVALLSRLVLTLPAAFIALFSPAAGFLVDRFGRSRSCSPRFSSSRWPGRPVSLPIPCRDCWRGVPCSVSRSAGS